MLFLHSVSTLPGTELVKLDQQQWPPTCVQVQKESITLATLYKWPGLVERHELRGEWRMVTIYEHLFRPVFLKGAFTQSQERLPQGKQIRIGSGEWRSPV